MNYKITTILLLIVAVGLIAYIVFNKEMSSEMPEMVQEESTLSYAHDDGLLTYIKERMDSVTNNLGQPAGKPISTEQARSMIIEYQKFMQSSFPGYDSTKAIYGFVFDLNSMKDFMNRIENYNTAPHSPEETITGVRVYYGRTILPGLSYNDVFLIPVKGADFTNFYPVDGQFPEAQEAGPDDPSILNYSLPCPTHCNP